MPVRVCFVCLGNICRSPTAEGVLRRLVAEAGLETAVEIDSAGTAAYHAGEGADPRSAEAARARGIELTSVARQFRPRDFERFDYVLAMDRENREHLRELAPDADAAGRVSLLRAFAGEADEDVPDPYHGGPGGFDDVFDICERACKGLLEHIRTTHGL
jgi:protein-tyrosine phosphatase